MPMLLTITIALSVLVIINFLLLIFSCNKTVKNKKATKKPIVFTPTISLKQQPQRLAPTGS